jgi:hypothetical protein
VIADFLEVATRETAVARRVGGIAPYFPFWFLDGASPSVAKSQMQAFACFLDGGSDDGLSSTMRFPSSIWGW